MTSFLAIRHYSPLIVLLVGLITFVGLMGVGNLALQALRFRLPSPWREVTGLLLGIQILSLTVQLVAMAGVAYRTVLILIWAVLVVLGGIAAVPLFRNALAISLRTKSALELCLLLVVLAALAANLLAAVAPSTKIDELYYHMLLPSRIVLDHALLFYLQPWEAAILPQMSYQIAMSPLHALNFPDASNVLSWGIGATLIWFAARLLSDNNRVTRWGLIWPASLVVGLYSVVHHVTGGSHALGDLSLAAAVTALYKREQLIENVRPGTFAGMVSIMLVSAATAKVSLLPVSALLLIIAAVYLFRSTGRASRLGIAIALILPWLIIAAPLMVWTLAKSGSPFGPFLSGIFASSPYDPEVMRQTFASSRLLNRPPLLDIVQHSSLVHPPIFWLAMVAVFFIPGIPLRTRLTGVTVLIFQAALIYLFLPYDLRFLGGLSFGLVICFALASKERVGKLIWRKTLTAALVVTLLPWLGVQIYYAQQFLPVVVGLQSRSEFYRRYVAFYSDYEELERILPKESVLIANFRTSAVYTPRLIYFDVADLPPDKDVFYFGCDFQAEPGPWPNFKGEAPIYENRNALALVFRTPGRPAVTDSLCVGRLVRK